MAARGDDGGFEEVFADLTPQRRVQRSEIRQRRVEPVGGVGDVEGGFHLEADSCVEGARELLRRVR